VYIIEVHIRDGRVCESYPTYEAARRRIAQFPAESLMGVPFIFKELADGSQRLVREDDKPLQWHRVPEDTPAAETPLPLSDPLPHVIEPLDLTTWPDADDADHPSGPG
jgi:hypothetical protein